MTNTGSFSNNFYSSGITRTVSASCYAARLSGSIRVLAYLSLSSTEVCQKQVTFADIRLNDKFEDRKHVLPSPNCISLGIELVWIGYITSYGIDMNAHFFDEPSNKTCTKSIEVLVLRIDAILDGQIVRVAWAFFIRGYEAISPKHNHSMC